MNIGMTERGNFLFDVGVGAIEGVEPVLLFGKGAPSTSVVDLWGQVIARSLPAAKMKFGVSSSSTNDAAAGTGARTVRLHVLDENYNETTEDVTLNGQTKVETTGQYLRFQKAEVLTAGSGGVNAGIVYVYDTSDTVTAGVPQTAAKIYGHMTVGDNRTNQAMVTVPLGKSYVLKKITLGQYDTAARYARFQLKVKEFGGVDKIYPLPGLCTAATTAFERAFDVPMVFPEKTEIALQCAASAAGSTLMACLEMIAA